MRFFLIPLLAFFVTLNSGFAQDSGTACALYGPSYQLSSDTVLWSMTIGSGQSCIRGLKSAFVTLDTVKLVTPPQAGQVKLEGPGFVYKGNSDFRGQDTFSLLISGKKNKVAGSSTIQFVVSIR
jgi:hypothetical protein